MDAKIQRTEQFQSRLCVRGPVDFVTLLLDLKASHLTIKSFLSPKLFSSCSKVKFKVYLSVSWMFLALLLSSLMVHRSLFCSVFLYCFEF